MGAVKGFNSEMSNANAGVLVDYVFDNMMEDAYRRYFVVWTGALFVNDVKGLETKAFFVIGKQDAALDLKYCQPALNAMLNAKASLAKGRHSVPLSNANRLPQLEKVLP